MVHSETSHDARAMNQYKIELHNKTMLPGDHCMSIIAIYKWLQNKIDLKKLFNIATAKFNQLSINQQMCEF